METQIKAKKQKKQLYNSLCQVMALQTMAVARQWPGSDQMGTPTDTNSTVA